jgi:hypothetical protein
MLAMNDGCLFHHTTSAFQDITKIPFAENRRTSEIENLLQAASCDARLYVHAIDNDRQPWSTYLFRAIQLKAIR